MTESIVDYKRCQDRANRPPNHFRSRPAAFWSLIINPHSSPHHQSPISPIIKSSIHQQFIIHLYYQPIKPSITPSTHQSTICQNQNQSTICHLPFHQKTINNPPINPYQPHPSTFPKDACALASNVSFGDKDLDQYQVAVGPLGSLG